MSDESKSTAASSTETVMFDVGGKIYKVSHSLLEQHSETVLAKLVDDKWLADSDKGKPVFIDRMESHSSSSWITSAMVVSSFPPIS